MSLSAPTCAVGRAGRTKARLFYWVSLTGCTLVACATVATAQTFYKWTDERGIVHFSDQPPQQAKGVEERNLPVPPTAGPDAVPVPQGPEGGPAGAAPGRSGAAAEGPARVILVSRQAPRTGPSAVHVAGKVQNVGGTDAQRVGVTISAIDSAQGGPCLQDEVPVTPSTLHPGEIGSFDTDVDSPCLFGDANVDVGPKWE
jgi:hypothetical protein